MSIGAGPGVTTTHVRSVRRLLLAAALGASALVVGSPARADDNLVVTTGTGTGAGSLPAVLAIANSDPDHDFISFDPAVTSVALGANAMPDITAPVTITGCRAGGLRMPIAGTAGQAIFRVAATGDGTQIGSFEITTPVAPFLVDPGADGVFLGGLAVGASGASGLAGDDALVGNVGCGGGIQDTRFGASSSGLVVQGDGNTIEDACLGGNHTGFVPCTFVGDNMTGPTLVLLGDGNLVLRSLITGGDIGTENLLMSGGTADAPNRVISSFIGGGGGRNVVIEDTTVPGPAAAFSVLGGPTVAEGNILFAPGTGQSVLVTATGATTIADNYLEGGANGPDSEDGSAGVRIEGGAADVTVDSNTVVHMRGAGISVGATTGPVTLTRNVVGMFTNPGAELTNTVPFGTADPANRYAGIHVTGADVTIGGTDAGNVIAGNASAALGVPAQVVLSGAGASDTQVLDNFVGTRLSGNVRLRGGGDGFAISVGVAVDGPDDAVVRGNVVSGNTGNGITVANAARTQVLGNLVGLGVDGTTVVPNGGNGIVLGIGAVDTQVGLGATPEVGNVVGGNPGIGILVGGGATGTRIQGNGVGTDLSGQAARPNATGIQVESPDTTVGADSASTTFSDGNVVSGNTGSGITLQDGAQGSLVKFNFVGLALDGTTPLGNGRTGIDVRSRDVVVRNNIVAANGAADPNSYGVLVSPDPEGIGVGGDGIELLDNVIGADENGVAGPQYANRHSVRVIGDQVRIGGTTGDEGNIITGGLLGPGVEVGAGSERVAIRGNRIWDNATNGIDLAAGAGSGVVPPVFTSATLVGATVEVAGTDPNPGAVLIDVYANRECTTPTDVEGERYLGTLTAVDGAFSGTVPAPPAGFDLLTMTATLQTPAAAAGSTSELVGCVEVEAAAVVPTTAPPTTAGPPTTATGSTPTTAAVSGRPLARTGQSTARPLVTGLALVALGVVLIGHGRRRRLIG